MPISLTRFVTPAEAGKMTAEEQRSFEDLREKINGLLNEQYVAGSGERVACQIPTSSRRVRQELKKGLEAAGWNVDIKNDGIYIGDNKVTEPVFVDRRVK